MHTGAVVDRSELPLGMTVENLSPDGRTMLLRPDGASTETHYACCDVVWDVHTGDELTKPTAPGLFRFGAFTGSFTAEGGMVLWGQNGPDQSIVRTLDTKGVATARHDEVGVAGTPEDPRLRVVADPRGLVRGGRRKRPDSTASRAPSLRPIGGPFFTETVSAHAFSSDGSLLATASGPNVTLWDVETHQQLGALDVGTDVDNVALIGGDHPRYSRPRMTRSTRGTSNRRTGPASPALSQADSSPNTSGASTWETRRIEQCARPDVRGSSVWPPFTTTPRRYSREAGALCGVVRRGEKRHMSTLTVRTVVKATCDPVPLQASDPPEPLSVGAGLRSPRRPISRSPPQLTLICVAEARQLSVSLASDVPAIVGTGEQVVRTSLRARRDAGPSRCRPGWRRRRAGARPESR